MDDEQVFSNQLTLLICALLLVLLALSWVFDTYGSKMSSIEAVNSQMEKMAKEAKKLSNIPAFEYDFRGEIKFDLYERDMELEEVPIYVNSDVDFKTELKYHLGHE
jgi:hypothetical protein